MSRPSRRAVLYFIQALCLINFLQLLQQINIAGWARVDIVRCHVIDEICISLIYAVISVAHRLQLAFTCQQLIRCLRYIGESLTPAQQKSKGHAQGVDIGAHVFRLTQQSFRGHVEWRCPDGFLRVGIGLAQ